MKSKILIIPAEVYPTHNSFLDEVFAKESFLYKSFFLMRASGKQKTVFGQSCTYTFPDNSGNKIVNVLKGTFCIDIRYLCMLPRIIAKEKIDIIMVRDLTFPLFIGLVLKFFWGKKLIYQKSHPHEYHRIISAKNSGRKLYYLSSIFENFILHRLLKYCDAVLPITDHMRTELAEKHSVPEEKMYSFGMGFNFENYLIPQLTKSITTFEMVYTGTLAKEREFSILLDGVRHLEKMKTGHQFTLTFSGGTKNEIQRLKDYSRNIGIENLIKFTGRISREEVYVRLKDLHHIGISWFGSHKRFIDASPTKLFEYLAFGLPSMGTDTVFENINIIESTNTGAICSMTAESVAKTLELIMENYDEYKENCLNLTEIFKNKYSYYNMRKQIRSICERI